MNWTSPLSEGDPTPTPGVPAAEPVFDRSPRDRYVLTREPLPRTGGSSTGGVASWSCGAGPGLRSDHRMVRAGRWSAAEAEALDQGPVARNVDRGQVLQQPAATADQQQETPPGVVVVLVHLEVLGQVADPLGQQRNLRLGGTGVTLVDPVGVQDRLLLCGVECHVL